jgi:hypothetical protein
VALDVVMDLVGMPGLLRHAGVNVFGVDRDYELVQQVRRRFREGGQWLGYWATDMEAYPSPRRGSTCSSARDTCSERCGLDLKRPLCKVASFCMRLLRFGATVI